jgi:hypothetical protein
MFGEFSLECSANLSGDLIIARRRTEPHLVDHLLRRHRASYRDDLPPRMLRINLSSEDNSPRIVMNGDVVPRVRNPLLDSPTNRTGVVSAPLVLSPPSVTRLTSDSGIPLSYSHQARDIEHYHESK